MRRVAIATKTWSGRNDTIQRWVDAWARAADLAGWDATILVCGSDGCIEPKRCIYDEHPNNPLSQKANHLFWMAKQTRPDWYMYLGDDDFPCDRFCHSTNAYLCGDFDYIGWRDMYFAKGGDVYYWQGYRPKRRDESIGAGRMLSRDLCDAIGWTHTDASIDRNLDYALTSRIKEMAPWVREKRLCMLEQGVCMVDFKDSLSVTDFRRFNPTPKKIRGNWPKPVREAMGAARNELD